MRVSILKNDPGYSDAALYCTAYLNGKLLEHCITADEELGIVIVQEYNKDGCPKLNSNKTRMRTTCLSGKIEIHLPDKK